jgi:NADPH:quinone reductase-like Zn-dependent oxidoreductase
MAQLRQSPSWQRAKRLHAKPETMRAVAIDRFGGAEVLSVHMLPVPQIESDEVLIAVDTAGVGPWDLEIRESGYGGRTRFPLILGVEGAGIIAARGSGVRRLKVGDAVYSYSWNNPKGGFYAEYVAVPATKVGHIPKSLDLKRSGAIAVTGLTALQGIDDALHLRRGETVVVHGATGGVGTLAAQFAKLRGVRVFGTAHHRDALALLRRLHVDAALDGRPQVLAKELAHLAPEGLDAVLALVGGEALERCIDAVRPGGRVAYPNGVEPEPRKRRNLTFTPYDAVSGVREFERLNRAVDATDLKIVFAGVYPLTRATDAHRRIAAGHVLGKVVLRTAR